MTAATLAEPSTILLVEDEQRLASLTAEYLRQKDFVVSIESHGDRATQRIIDEQPDLVILDIMLPGEDGYSICRKVREHYRGAILMFTAKDEDFEQIMGLEIGADDYLIKPVEPRLLLAHIKALLRRTPDAPGGAVPFDENPRQFGTLRVDPVTRRAALGDEVLDLSDAEWDLLWMLSTHVGEILSRDALLQALRGIDFDGLDRSIDARISRLRKKISDDPEQSERIKTVRGKGYMFCG